MPIHLPDEIVAEILSPALKVPDDAFSDNSRDSPFAQYSESSSALLLVCKSWLRVSTPLLYHVVVLRSKGQAAALERTLKRSPDLGRFIKKLRLEGGFGNPLQQIIQAAPNVTDLFLPLSIWSDDNAEGLIQGLASMNPNRVILLDNPKIRFNKNSRRLQDAVKECLKSWGSLVRLSMSLIHGLMKR
ncbi:hypothetical protein FB45DRAFT_735456 [Roridomyces roridus]|uniref:F-box domain-containing protein n=1 Tax=Roridomyces roridus TaxID=1738132 RepID=A0AAD7CBW5_9AGAR|nr:hypothetical protein FB45DRAFT_735456 [Roridomyces roridus]